MNMTTADYRKTMYQLKGKPAKNAKYIKHNFPKKRTCGLDNFHCIRCHRTGAHIKKYGLHICRQCFREVATNIGFKKYS